jgi:hypothetical protein
MIVGAAAAQAWAGPQDANTLVVDPRPRFELSSYLYMQFIEPLGTTDSSVEAAWDLLADDWRKDVFDAIQDLAPPMLRFGGNLSDYYRWREAVGPRAQRVPLVNQEWGGIESNQVGTREFVQLCQRVGAEPLMCVNFESDGRTKYRLARGSLRVGDAAEAAAWVAYCNQPHNAERRAHGCPAPLTIRYWQVGNETSYVKEGFDLETAARKTVEFARAMRAVDPQLQLIAWGDTGWTARMAEVAGGEVQMLAFHHMFNPDSRKQPVLAGERYRRDPAATWAQLMQAWTVNDAKIRQIRHALGHSPLTLAMTECHFAIPGRNRCEVLATWAAGVSYARVLNNHQRHGDVLKIATAADFFGTRWLVNALMIPTPASTRQRAYLMPVGRVMRLYRHHMGTHAVSVAHTPDGLDVVASRRGDRLFLHVANTERTRSIRTRLLVADATIRGGRVYQIADDPMVELSELNSQRVMQVVEKPLAADGTWDFPAASVSAVELDLA